MDQKREIRIPWLTFGCILGFSLCACQSGPESIPGILLSGKVAQDVVTDAEESGRNLLAEARSTGDALAAKTANELEVATKNAILLLGDQLDKTYDQLRPEFRLALQHLEKLRLSAESFRKGAFDLKDSLVLDLTEMYGALLPYARTDFFIQAIEGVTQLQKNGDYTIAVKGIGFGTDSDRRRGRILSISIDGKNVPEFKANKVQAHRTTIHLPNGALPFEERSVKMVPVVVTVEVDSMKRGWFSGCGKSTEKNTFELPFHITLLPQYAGKLNVEYRVPRIDWVGAGRREYKWTTPDHHQSGGDIEHYHHSTCTRIEDPVRFGGSEGARKEGLGAPWANDPRAEVKDGGRQLCVSAEMWGHAFDVHYWADTRKLAPVGEETKQADLVIVYGKNAVLELPEKTSWWRLTGETTLFHPIDVVKEGSMPDLEFKDLTTSGTTRKITYFAPVPE